jgi:hypothetical protein
VIKFEGYRGMRFRGDIAIDDVSLTAECFGQGKFVLHMNIDLLMHSYMECKNGTLTGRRVPKSKLCSDSGLMEDKLFMDAEGVLSPAYPPPGIKIGLVRRMVAELTTQSLQEDCSSFRALF